ncbi:RNA polymerase sigma factor [Tepidibacillus fermentans]|uniref:RNA polymerase sigma-30 (SigH) subunit n=1 Tax=Tepidibacillus fermentans TaxID=1281767 RepID=A0A4V6NYY2_9BACI|nr:sigma-70 family RNA polymerase sigma factor [Tepidibacillus fermentans]TCS81252.1 RNA polymerase sigma-30 (SigH) subunit [Tepidibacillus fermentans]
MEEIVRQAQQGDQNALAILLKKYHPLIVTFANKRYIHNNFEDTLQEARLAFILAVKYYDPSYGVFFGHYIKQRIWQHLFSLMKKEQKWNHVIFFEGWQGEGHRILVDHIDLEFTIWKEQLASLLSEREKQLFELHWIQGYSISEIADRYKISINTVKTWKKRAVKKLAKFLSPTKQIDSTIVDVTGRGQKYS